MILRKRGECHVENQNCYRRWRRQTHGREYCRYEKTCIRGWKGIKKKVGDDVSMKYNTIEERHIGWDILRIMLAVIVFAFHANIHLHLTFGILNDFVSVGAFCMTGFFMLSGAVLYLRYGSQRIEIKDLLKFYKKRAIGIVPLYLVVMLLFYLDNTFSRDDLILLPAEILGIQSFFSGSFSFGHNGGTWFVSCLLICYFLFPLFNELIRGMRTKGILILCICLGIVDIYSQLITGRYGFAELYSAPFLRCIQFMIGCAIASRINRDVGKVRNSIVIACVLIITIISAEVISSMVRAGAFQNATYLQRLAMYDVVAVPCFALLLYLLGQLKAINSKCGGVIGRISSLSYPFFLAQFFTWSRCQDLFVRYRVENNRVKIAIAFLMCIGIAVLLHIAVEKLIKMNARRKIKN